MNQEHSREEIRKELERVLVIRKQFQSHEKFREFALIHKKLASWCKEPDIPGGFHYQFTCWVDHSVCTDLELVQMVEIIYRMQ